MCERDDRNYYNGRWEQAIKLGDQAMDPKIAAIHYELALRYAMLAVQGSPARPEIIARLSEPAGKTPRRARTIIRSNVEPDVSRALQHA